MLCCCDSDFRMILEFFVNINTNNHHNDILFNKPFRKRSDIFLHKSNLIIIVVLLANIILVGAEAIKCKNAIAKNVVNKTQDIVVNYNDNCISIFAFTLLFGFLFHALFFFRKFRTKISLTVISIFLLAIYNNYERVVVFITNHFRDYLQSSWSTYYDRDNPVWAAAFTALYFIVCWVNNPKLLFGRALQKSN
jgi:lysylphosphatidylglycerol synthetase-like protein (DUF2156 family)